MLTSSKYPVTWDFTLILQGKVSRYGHINDIKYKQFLPAGLELADTYPPRPIDDFQYAMAEKRALEVNTNKS